MNPVRKWLRLTLATLLLAALMLQACATNQRDKSLSATVLEYEKIVRWSQWDATLDFLSPASLEEHPVTPLDLDRLRLFRVTAYEIRSAAPYDDGLGFRQTVQIRLFNKNRAVERGIIDVQDWRYDEDRQRWFLHSGLPDVTKGR